MSRTAIQRRLAALEAALTAEYVLRQDVHEATRMCLSEEQRALVNSFAQKNEVRGYPIELGCLHCTELPDWATAEEIAAALVYERVYLSLYRQRGGRHAPLDVLL